MWYWAHFHVLVGICMPSLENVYSDHLPLFKIRHLLFCCWFIWGLFVFNFDILMFNIFHWFANSQNPYVFPWKAFTIYSTPCLSLPFVLLLTVTLAGLLAVLEYATTCFPMRLCTCSFIYWTRTPVLQYQHG